MSKIYQIVPSNRKTLFLRNLEKILTSHDVMCECQTKTFRKIVGVEILELLEYYSLDVKNNSVKFMNNKFESDCLITRFIDDRRKLSVNHSHQ